MEGRVTVGLLECVTTKEHSNFKWLYINIYDPHLFLLPIYLSIDLPIYVVIYESQTMVTTNQKPKIDTQKKKGI